MTSFRQIEANRRNALKSTGPTSEAGNRRSGRNAVRHGLTAETIVEGVEDPEDYKAFEASVTADYDAQSAVERELVLRLASLLWRLRRATAIETGLLQIQNDILRGTGNPRRFHFRPLERSLDDLWRVKGSATYFQPHGARSDCQKGHEYVSTNKRCSGRSATPSPARPCDAPSR
jgi:hypothetical protein